MRVMQVVANSSNHQRKSSFGCYLLEDTTELFSWRSYLRTVSATTALDPKNERHSFAHHRKTRSPMSQQPFFFFSEHVRAWAQKNSISWVTNWIRERFSNDPPLHLHDAVLVTEDRWRTFCENLSWPNGFPALWMGSMESLDMDARTRCW